MWTETGQWDTDRDRPRHGLSDTDSEEQSAHSGHTNTLTFAIKRYLLLVLFLGPWPGRHTQVQVVVLLTGPDERVLGPTHCSLPLSLVCWNLSCVAAFDRSSRFCPLTFRHSVLCPAQTVLFGSVLLGCV